MAEIMGQSVLTYDGVLAYQAAALTGSTVKPAYFKFSEADLLDPAAHDVPAAWIQLPITAYVPIDRDTVEYICECPPEAATGYCRTAGLFLESGALIMLARPPYPFPPALRQRFRIQFRYGNVQALTDFALVPYDQFEQDAALLAVQAGLSEQILAGGRRLAMTHGQLCDFMRTHAQDLAGLEALLGQGSLAVQAGLGEQILAASRLEGWLRHRVLALARSLAEAIVAQESALAGVQADLRALRADLAPPPALVRSSAAGLAAITGFAPSLYVDLLEAAALPGGVPAGFAFARPSTGTYFGLDGRLRTAAAGELRHEWDPDTGAYLGALIEESRTNFVRHSGTMAAFDSEGGATISPAPDIMAPDGISPAMMVDAQSGEDFIYVDADVSPGVYSRSVFVRRGSASSVLIKHPAAGAFAALYDFNTGHLAGSGALQAQRLVDGWVRISGVGMSATGATGFEIHPSPDGPGYTYCWGAQMEAGPAATSYIPTTDAPATRAADALTKPTAGWLRPGVGTMVCEAQAGPAGSSGDVANLRADPFNRITVAAGRIDVVAGGETQAIMAVDPASMVYAVAYAANDIAMVSDRSPLQVDAGAVVPDTPTLVLGSDGAGVCLNGIVRRFAYFPARLPDSALRALAG